MIRAIGTAAPPRRLSALLTSAGTCKCVPETSAPHADAMMIGLWTGSRAMLRNRCRTPGADPLLSPISVSTIGVTSTVLNRITVDRKTAFPSTWTATGMPRFAEFTYPEAMPTTAPLGVSRPNRRVLTTKPSPQAASELAPNARIEVLASACRSAFASIPNSEAGIATRNTNRPSTASTSAEPAPTRLNRAVR